MTLFRCKSFVAFAAAAAALVVQLPADAQLRSSVPTPSEPPAGSVSSGKVSRADAEALRDMQVANMAEVMTGAVALDKAQDPQVKAFAQTMIDDHTAAMKDVEEVAQQKGVALPTEPDGSHQAAAIQLSKLSGADFDKKYMSMTGVGDHRTIESKLRKTEKDAKDTDVKALAGKMLPVVHGHLRSAERIGGQ